MPYKISGEVNVSNVKIIIINDHDVVESITIDDGGNFSVLDLISGDKTIIALSNRGNLIGYGSIPGVYSVPTHAFRLDSSRLDGDYLLS